MDIRHGDDSPDILCFNLEHLTKLKSDTKDFNRKGVAWLADGRLVILNHGNDELKVFDRNLKQLLSKQISIGCRSLAASDESSIAVTLDRRIYFYRIDQRRIRETGRCYTLTGFGYGLTYSEQFCAVAVDVRSEKKSIAVMDGNGKIIHNIKKIKMNDDVTCKSFFTYMALDPARHALYISDVYNNKLMCVSFSEKLRWERNMPGKPRGVCALQDHLIVGTSNKQLLVFNKEDGKLLKLLANLDYEPECIAYDTATRKLAVSQYYKGWVHIYQMS